MGMINNIFNSCRKYYLGVLFVFIILFSSIFFIQNRTEPKCPEDFPDTDKGSANRVASMNRWTNSFYDVHPGATLGGWAKSRLEFYKENNCTISLQRYNDAKAGKADPETMKMIKATIKEEINKLQ